MATTNDYVGAFTDDAAADAYMAAYGFPKYVGVYYRNTTTNNLRFWDGSSWDELQPGGSGGPTAIENPGPPNGTVTGTFGQLCRDTLNDIWYVCRSNPTGTDWDVI